MRRVVLAPIALAALALAAAPAAAEDGSAYAKRVCAQAAAGEHCIAGGNIQTSGGGGKVSHKGWPAISGVLMKTHGGAKVHTFTGDDRNDEILGHHGDDTLVGGAGRDVLWGDWDPVGNTESQKDVLRGGDGDDFLYPSHGRSTVSAGAGSDYIWAYYGRGTIDCGPGGHDVVHVRDNGAFTLKHCEYVKHTF